MQQWADHQKDDKKILYKLTGIIDHPKNKEKRQSSYRAIVKKHVDGEDEKQWFSFHRLESTQITIDDALESSA